LGGNMWGIESVMDIFAPVITSVFLTECPRSHHTPDFTYLFISLCLHFMTWHDVMLLDNLVCQWTYEKAAIRHDPDAHFLIICLAKLTAANISSYCTEELWVESVWVHKKTAQVRRWIRWFHGFGGDFGSRLRAGQLIPWMKHSQANGLVVVR
jgi:hypothetical protein